MEVDIRCPYCNKEQEINHDDGYGYEEGVIHQQECGDCNKIFTYTTAIYYHYRSKKAPCLNGDKHNWKKINRLPKSYFSNKHRCEWCNKEELIDKTLFYDDEDDVWLKKN